MKKKHDRHLSSNKRDFEIAKKSQKGGPGTFWFYTWRPEGVFHVLLGGGGWGVLGPFLVGTVLSLPAMTRCKQMCFRGC